MTRNFLAFVVAIFASVFLSACKYSLAGSPQPLPFRTIAVKQVVNDSYAPQASAPLTTQICRKISESPALELVDLDDAQAVLEVEIIDYAKDTFATKSTDTALARAMTVNLRAKATLKNLKDGSMLFKDKIFEVDSRVFSNGSMLDNEYSNMPVMTDELARKIVDSVLGVW